MNTIFYDFLDRLVKPIILCDSDGEVLYINSVMEYLFKYIKMEPPHNISEIDETFNSKELLKNEYTTKNLKILELYPRAHIYVKETNNSIIFVYLIDSSIIKNKTIDKVIEHIDEMVVIFNENGVIEKINSIGESILPINREEIVGKSIYTITGKGLVTDPIMIEMIEKKKKIYRNVVFPNGKTLAYTAIPLFYPNGKLSGGVLTGRDITRLIKFSSQMNFDSQQPEPTEYISKSKIMENIKDMAIRAAASDSSIFITGESGVGKEIIAQTIYRYSPRRDKPYTAINCGAIPSELLESELFGYEEGAFTGAKKNGKKGLLEDANGGTVFLDEIGELPLPMQTKLLRVIQENSFTRIGGNKPIKVDIRYISATNISCEALHKSQNFRQDLYYRLSVIPIKIPPLRERRDDIPPLVEYFIKFYNKKYNRKIKISTKAMHHFCEYDWPGNIRELKNMVERLIVLSTKDLITEDEFNILLNLDSSKDFSSNGPSITIPECSTIGDAYQKIEQIMIPSAIRKYGSINKAAKMLGIDQSTIHRKIKSGHITLEDN